MKVFDNWLIDWTNDLSLWSSFYNFFVWSLGVITIFLWDVYKSDMRICFPCRIVESHDKGAGWMWLLVDVSVFFWLILNILQAHRTSLILLIFDLCIFHLLDHRLLILKPVLGCDCKLSVVHIKIGHNYLLPLQVYGRLWLGCKFFISLAIINWLTGFKSIYSKFSCLVLWSIFRHLFINVISVRGSKVLQKQLLKDIYWFINIITTRFYC